MEKKDYSIRNIFTTHLPADNIKDNFIRQVVESCFSYVETRRPTTPSFVHVNTNLKSELGLSKISENDFLKLMSGQTSFNGFDSYAMCYGGHQFGNWAGQLGDGRAINIGEIFYDDKTKTLQLKGSGPTPYSRRADGNAVLRSSIREYLCSEAMFHLGISTTRALSLVLSGEMVMRDIMYDGHPKQEPGAIVCRVSDTFLRFGNFEILSARQDKDTLKTLVDFTIKQYFPHIGTPSKDTYLAFFKEIVESTKQMILNWQRVGFVHGVMNTDNMSILGQTIDYGPYGWLEDYDPEWTPNTTDSREKRYGYGNQPSIALWNLSKLASALFPIINDAKPLEDILLSFRDSFQLDYLKMMLTKIGIVTYKEGDEKLITDLQTNLRLTEIDMTIFFRNLSKFDTQNPEKFYFEISKSSYMPDGLFDTYGNIWKTWLNQYKDRLSDEETPLEIRLQRMNRVNPKYVLRNYMAQLAIDAAEKGDYGLINELYTLLQNPYDEQLAMEKWFVRRPDWAKDKVGCSMLSCSS